MKAKYTKQNDLVNLKYHIWTEVRRISPNISLKRNYIIGWNFVNIYVNILKIQ